MKSSIYSQKSGAEQRPTSGEELSPDTVELILVERPYTFELNERLLGVARSRIVGANAKWVYLYYQLTSNHSNEKLSLRATAKALNMPWETFRRARKELEETHVIIAFGSDRFGPRRLLVRDIRDVGEVAQNEPEGVAQNESAQNEPLDLAFGIRGVNTLSSSKNRIKSSRVTSKLRDNVSHLAARATETPTLDESFPDSPARPRPRPYKLMPPPGPDDGPNSPRARRKPVRAGTQINYVYYKTMYAICYGANTPKQQRTLTGPQIGRAGKALATLHGAGANLDRLRDFERWWWTWAKSAPSPEKLQEFWWRAMNETDGVTTPAPPGYEEGKRIEWTEERIRNFTEQRAKELRGEV